VAVTFALLSDREAGDAATRAAVVNGATGRWVDAARTALAHPGLAASARACFAAAEAAVRRLGTGAPLADAVGAYAERWVDRGRTPADDRLDAWAERRAPFPEPEEVTSWT
jgi:glutamate--cysteine ligase